MTANGFRFRGNARLRRGDRGRRHHRAVHRDAVAGAVAQPQRGGHRKRGPTGPAPDRPQQRRDPLRRSTTAPARGKRGSASGGKRPPDRVLRRERNRLRPLRQGDRRDPRERIGSPCRTCTSAAWANGVPDLEIVEPDRLAEIEPHTRGVRALWAPHTGIVDYVRVANAYAGKFQSAGGDIFTGAAGQAGAADRRRDDPRNRTRSPPIEARDQLRGPLRRQTGAHDGRGDRRTNHPVPRRVLQASGNPATIWSRGLIYPVPDPRFPFLGVHYTRNIHGYVEAGPNAVLAWGA